MNLRKRLFALAALSVLTACGSTSTGPAATTSGPSKVASLAAEVPDSFKGSPVQIAVDATYAPNEFIDPNTGAIVGWDIDLGNQICKVLGLVCTFNNVTFDDIIPQLLASTPAEVAGGDQPRYVLSISSWTPTTAREAKGIDFVTYYKAGESWMEKVGGATISSAADMCGHNVAVEKGTIEESDAWGYMGMSVGGTPIKGDTNNCTAAGKQAINVLSFLTQTEANSALLSGRADFGFLDQPVADYQVKQSKGKFQIGGQACSVAPYGIAMVKGSQLSGPIMDALRYLIDNNYYNDVLTNWGVQDGAIPSGNIALNTVNYPPSFYPTATPCVPAY